MTPPLPVSILQRLFIVLGQHLLLIFVLSTRWCSLEVLQTVDTCAISSKSRREKSLRVSWCVSLVCIFAAVFVQFRVFSAAVTMSPQQQSSFFLPFSSSLFVLPWVSAAEEILHVLSMFLYSSNCSVFGVLFFSLVLPYVLWFLRRNMIHLTLLRLEDYSTVHSRSG